MQAKGTTEGKGRIRVMCRDGLGEEAKKKKKRLQWGKEGGERRREGMTYKRRATSPI